MLVLVQLWVALAILAWGIAAILVGLGTHSVSKYWVGRNDHVGDPSPLLLVLGLGFVATGLATVGVALGWDPLRGRLALLIAIVLLLVSIQLVSGHLRFETNVSLTMRKRARMDSGLLSRVIGAVLFVAGFYLLAASNGWFGWSLSPRLISAIVSVCATLLASVLINLLTGSVTRPDAVPPVIPALVGIVAFALILTQTPLWPLGAREPEVIPLSQPQQQSGGALEVVSSKAVLRVSESAVLSVMNLDPALSALTFRWQADHGIVPDSWVAMPDVAYTAPAFTVVDVIRVTVRDASGKTVDTAEYRIQIVK